MSIEQISGVVQQIQQLAQGAGGVGAERGAPATGFAEELRSAIHQLNQTQMAARTQAEEFAVGKPGVALNDVMVDLQKSSVSLQMGIQVRNKLIAAYQDVMSMQV